MGGSSEEGERREGERVGLGAWETGGSVNIEGRRFWRCLVELIVHLLFFEPRCGFSSG